MSSDDPYLALRQRVARGVAAQVYIEDPVLNEVLEQVENDAISVWRNARGQTLLSVREHSHAVVVGVDAVRGQLRAMVADAELARQEMDRLDEEQEQE